MNILSNPKHELFAQALATGKTQEQAYIEAGYRPDRGAASRLSSNINILGRVKELQEIAAMNAEITIDDILQELEQARMIAKENQNPSAMVSATMGKAKLLGLITDKTKTELTGKANEPLPNMLFVGVTPNTHTYDEWKQIEAARERIREEV